MGKIMVIGNAERDYAPDRCTLNLEIKATGDTAGKASLTSSEECEKLLSKLVALGIKPEDVEIYRDQIERDYRSKGSVYDSQKFLRIDIPASMSLVNSVRQVIESGFKGVSFSANYSISNEADLNRQLLKEAIADSKRQAEFLAESMGIRVTGIDTANLSGIEDIYDLTEEPNEVRMYGGLGGRALSDQLKPEKVNLSAHVKIVWLVG